MANARHDINFKGELDELPISTVAWKAAHEGLSELELPDLLVKNPRFQEAASNTVATQNESDRPVPYKAFALPGDVEIPIPSEGFVLQGDVEIFGTSIVGQLEKWMGPPPADVVVGIDPPCWERVTLPGDFHLSTLLPLLKDTPYDVITFRNVAIWQQNCEFDKTRAVGWHFDAGWVIDTSCGILHYVLRTVLQVDESELCVQMGLGTTQRWNAPIDVHSFTLEGTFPGLTLSPIPGLQLTSIGVRLLGIRGFELSPTPHTTLSYGFNIFGTMALDVPGSIIPLSLTYNLGVASEHVTISAELSDDIWKNALGVQNLKLEDVTFMTSFPLSSVWTPLSFSTTATFWYLSSQAVLSGTVSPGSGQLALAAGFNEFGIREIDSIFFTLFGESLSLPDYDLQIGSAILSIASDAGISLALQNVNVAGYTAPDVAVSLSTSGVQLSGALSSNKTSFGEASIHNAALIISFWTEKTKKQADIMLAGALAVDFLDAPIGAAVHLYPGGTGVDWVITASLSTHGKPIAISEVVSAIEKGSYLDLSLKDAVIIVASKDDAAISLAFPRQYAVRQGIQVTAVVDSLPVLSSLLRTDVSGLILSAGWSKGSGFDLKIALPASTTLDFGRGIRSTPISLEIQTEPLQLAVSASVSIPVKDSTPLDFSFVLEAGVTKASALANTHGWWVGPFGVDNLKIGPAVTLSIEIIYEQFLATGTPSEFGVVGGLMIGNTPAQVAMQITEDPQGQLLFAELPKLEVSDVISFGGELVLSDIPKIPDLLKFEEPDVYIRPSGVNVGGTTYPAGFSFKAGLLFLEHRADIEGTIDKAKKSIFLNGGVDNFEMGPLLVHGATGPRAKLGCELGFSKQELVIDGVVALFDAQAQIYIHLGFLPNPVLTFHALLPFARILTYQLDAELLGSLNSLKDADFSLTSTFESRILDYVAQQIIEQLEAVNAAAAQGHQVAHRQMEAANTQWQSSVDNARRQLLEARTIMGQYEQSVRGSNQHIIDNWLAEVGRLQSNINDAQATRDGAEAEARNKWEEAGRKRVTELGEARAAVAKARQQMAEGIATAQRALDDAKAALTHAFGDALGSIQRAANEVATLQRQIDSTGATIREYHDASIFEGWKKAQLIVLGPKYAALHVAKTAAESALAVASAAVQGALYVSRDAAVTAAKLALDAAPHIGQAALDVAERFLAETDKITQMAVDQADDILELAKTGPNLAALQGAQQVLEAYELTHRAAYDGAVSAIAGLMNSEAYLAYTAAQAALDVAEHYTALLDATKASLQLAERASGTIATVMSDVSKFGAKSVNIESISLSGTLRRALGLGGETGRPLFATVKGHLLGKAFEREVVFDPKDTVAFVKDLFEQLWNILRAGHDIVAQEGGTSNVKFAPAPILPVPAITVAFDTLVTSEGEMPSFDNLLPPVPAQHLWNPALSTNGDVTYLAPLIAVEDQVGLLPFAIARARFIEYRETGTHEDTEQAKQRGLVVLPAGPFTAGPPSFLFTAK